MWESLRYNFSGFPFVFNHLNSRYGIQRSKKKRWTGTNLL